MKTLLSLGLVLFLCSSPLFAGDSCASKWKSLFPKSIDTRYQSLVGKCDNDLKIALAALISKNTNANYTTGRLAMYGIDRTADNTLCSVYTDICINYKSGNPSSFNCEHTWPQSMGATGIAKADVHHLYATDSKTNSLRGNLPFCTVASGGTTTEEESVKGKDRDGMTCFEPKGEHKGALARSMFYFSVRYKKSIDAKQEANFRDWNARAVSDHEKIRNDKVEAFQHNRNPFVDHPELVELIADF